MDKHHIIDDVEFDISFDSMGSAREHEAGLPDFIRERLLPVADEIFCELADGDTVVRIDRLELDLGDIRHGEFRDEMESRFGEKLRALLREKMQSFATTHSPLEGMIGRPQAEQGQLEVFLETGRMPWHDQRATGDTVDALLEQTLARQGGEFAEFMKRTPHRDVVVKRLSMQFSDRLLTDVMRLFAPAHAVLLGELTGKLGDMWKDMPASITAKELKAQVWERLIGEHLKTGVPDPEWLLREISKDLFVRHARSSLPQASEGANESLREFHVKDASVENGESAGNLPGHARGSGEVVDKTGNERRADVSLAASAASAAKQSDASSERRSNIARQRAQLETAFATGDADELAGQWDALRNDYRELVREVFMQRMGDGKLLEKLAEGFPESMLHDLLNILSQQDGGFMAELSDLPELRGAKNEKSSAFWIYTLGFLHGAQDSDRAEYARGLIRSLSAQGMEQAPLLQALIALAPELQAALADMQAEHATDSRPPAEEPARAEELYRRVTQRLNGTSGEPEFAALLEEMANACPETLARLQRQVQSGELHADVGTLDAREAGQMVAALIRLNSGVKESDFLRAVETQAQQARDRQRYYCHILERLIRNETVDLEAALGVSGNETAQQDVRAASVGDAAPGQQPSAQPGRQSKGQERITRPLAEFAGTGRAAELYRRVTRHLSGVSDGEPEFAAMVEEMASVYPESLAYVQRQLQSGELRADIGRLDAVEARQLVVSLIRLNSGAKESDFLRAIGRYAGRAKSERGYYQRVLENMICNRTIDLVDAVRSQGEIVSRDLQRTAPDADGMVAAGSSSRQEDRATVDAEPALEPVKLLRIRLEEALVLGRAEGVEAVWGELLQSHVAMLREVFVQRLDSEVARSRLVDEFPEPMLYGLIRALAPADGGFVEMLAGQPELRSSGMAGAKNIPLLEYTLSYLHACGASGYDRFEYARGLVRSLAEQGFARTDTLRAIVRIDPELEAAMIASGGTMTAFGGEVVPASESCGEGAADSVSQGLLAGTLIRKLLQRLCDRDRTLAREIGELAEAWPEVAREFYRQLQLDAVALDVAVLSAREASLHAAAFIVSNHGRMGDDFLREIELHAGKAQDELHYHRTILEMLLHNKVVDLEVAMIAAPGSAIWEEGSLVHSRMDDAPGIGALRTRFESALMEGDAEAITDVWDELRFNRGALVREVFNLRMGEGASRKKLAERFPEAMLFELMRVLAPLASGFIESLDKQLGLQGGVVKAGDVRLAAREHALAYIYAFGARDFKRDEYARGLMHRMAVQGMDASLFWRAMAAIDPVLTLSLPESRIGGAARVGETPSPVGGTTRVVETQPIVEKTSQPALHAETGRTAELYERLVLHLSRQDGRDEPAADYAREIAELADAYPETLKRLYRRLQTDELDMDALSLNAGEARQLAVFFAGLAQGNEGIDFQREINARVGKVKDERGFYRHILEKLVCNQSVDFDAAMNEVQRTSDHIARLRILLETSFATGDADELAGQWEALRNDHRELVREVFMRRMGDGKLLKKLAEGFPESMLLELLNILSPQDSGFMAALSGLPKLRGAKNEKNTAFWRYTLGHLHGAQDGDRAEYARGLIRSLSVQGMEQGSLLQALVALAPELRAPLADMQSQPATGARAPAEEPARAEELYRRVAQRLNGDSGEPEFAVLIEEMASAYPEALARLQRQLQSGELRAEVWTLGAREAEQMAVALIRLNAGARENDLFHAVETQAQQARDRQRYYCYILERLIRNETVDLEAALDDAGNEAVQQNVRLDSVCDAAPGQQLSAQPDRNHGGQDSQSDGQEKISRLVAEFATSGRAAELYRRVTRRLSGASGGEPEFSALVEEMANAYPEMLAYLQRQLKSGELRADVGRLDAGEARQLVVSLIRLNSGAKENGFLRAVDAQARQAGDRQRYYRYVLERLIRNEMVDLEAALDDAAPGNDAMPQAERSAPAGDMARDEETSQLQNVAHTSDEVASPARTAWLRTLLDTALSEGNADELVGVWDEIRQRHAGLVRESFLRRMDDENARQRVVQGFPATPLAELVRILAPMESDFVETLATQLQQEQGSTSNAKNTPLWKYTMSYLHATASSGFDRRDYVGGLMNSLSEQGASRADILQAVARADAALGPTLSARQDMHDDTERASAAVTETSATGTERADELFRRVTQRLNGTSRDPEFAALLEEMASAYPETLSHLLRQLQAGELRADVGTLDAPEARAVATAMIRLNSGVRESEFLHAVDRYATRAQNEQGYYRFILENLLLDRAIDLEEAASVVAQETARAADDRAEENKVLPGATPGDKQRPQMAEDVRPRATTGDKTMQVENTSAFDEHWSKDAGDSESAEEIYIANAGMVLATPYLPRLFGMLELTEGSKFKDERSAERAIHLLQFMVNESCDSPEFLLSLNKLMCGVPTGVPIVREIELLPREKEAIEGMLNGIIRNWPILGNTSVQGLRESFLQRSGRLQLKEDNWHLKVESKGIDVLLDRLPWSFALIKHPWMRRPIYVEWR